ncbi:uncharacterized protein LOC134266775 [Saccostrea cucullata]|uniref:uncharacterized protein LOC134266775 n=1 Tax=Saccostrea cuccullata TaxID=36930 RepID=UPI002ED52580
MASSTPTATPCRGAPATGSTPTVSPEETNFLRFVNLVLRRAPKAIRIHFDTVHPPINLVTDLATQKTLLFSLKARKVINQVQWDKLFKVNNPMSKDFDVTLLICLLRNMNPSTLAPAGGFDILPNPSDVSTGADLARIKFYRNEVAHSANARMDANDFNTSWTHVEEAIGRLGGSALLNETKALRFSPMDESEKELLLELLLEIKHLKMEQLETIPPNVRELIEEKLVSWEKEDELFVEIRASTAVENFVNDNPCVVVVGHPGSGKSAIIHHIALKMGKQGFSIIPIDHPDEIKSYHDRKNPQVFVIDDPCGEFIVDEQAASAWVKYSKDIETCLNFQQKEDQVKSKLLVSCRFVVSRTRPFRLIKIFSNFIINLENHENKLTVFEKEQILSVHVQHEVHLPQLVIEKNFDCFPYLCKIYANAFTDSACMEAFFENPFIELVSKLNVMVDDPRSEAIHEYCALVCCALAEKRVNSYVMGIKRNVADEHLQEILNACDRQIDSSNLLSALERMNGKYVKKVGCTFALIHSKFLEVVVWHFGNRCPETLILHSCTEIFQNRLRPQGRLQKDFDFKEDKTLLELDKKWMKFYSKRIQNDISQGNFRNIFKNPCMPNALIETCLFDSLVDGHILEETLLKTNLNIPSIITEAYASFSREDLLENSQVKFLHLTIAYNWAAFLEKLFETRNDVLFETLFSQRASTLHLAILSENIEIVQMCLQYYSETFDSLEEFMNFGITYDTHCLFCGIHLTDLSHKLYCPVTQVRIPLLVCVTGKLEILEYLIQKKVCSQKDLISEYQLFEETVSPLMVTSLHGHCSIVRYLLQQGASVNYQNENGISPLHEACQRGHLEVIKILLSNGAKVNSRDTDEETPLSLACRNDFIEIADQLLCNGADINLQDSQGLTPIHKSISDWNIKTVEFLTERNCDINIVSRRGDTPFSLACFYGNCAIVRLLIEKGINRQQLQDGMLKACVKGNKGIISILLEYGAEINWKNTQGLTALHISCAQNNADLVTYLFVKGWLQIFNQRIKKHLFIFSKAFIAKMFINSSTKQSRNNGN